MAATRNILHSCSLIDNKLVSGQWPYVERIFTDREDATHYIATRWAQVRKTKIDNKARLIEPDRNR